MPQLRRHSLLPALALLLGAVGCSNTTTTYPSLGRLSAQAVDAKNVGVQGIVVDLYRKEGGSWLLWRTSTTGSNGIGEFGASDGGVIAGEYLVRVRFVTQHELAPGESNDRPVTVKDGDNIVVTFRVVPKDSGHVLAQIAVPSDFMG